MYRLTGRLTEYQLCFQGPTGRDAPLCHHPLIDDRVDVLQIASKPFQVKRRPQVERRHGVVVLGERLEVPDKARKLGLVLADRLQVFEKQDLFFSAA